MMPPQITTWQDWAEILLGWLLASFLIGFLSAASRDAINHWRQSRRRRPSLSAKLQHNEDRLRAALSQPIGAYPKMDQAMDAETVAARVAAAKTGYFVVEIPGFRERLANAIGIIAAKLQAWLRPKPRKRPEEPVTPYETIQLVGGPAEGSRWIRHKEEEYFGVNNFGGVDTRASAGSYHRVRGRKSADGFPICSWRPPASYWPSGMGGGIAASQKARRDATLMSSRFVRVVATHNGGGPVSFRLEGTHDLNSPAPWRKISAVTPPCTSLIVNTMGKLAILRDPAARPGTS